MVSPLGATVESAFTGLSSLFPVAPANPQKSGRGLACVYTLQIADGSTAWHLALNNGQPAMPGWLIADNGILYTNYADYEHTGTGALGLLALSSKDGSIFWARSSDFTPDGVSDQIAVAKEVVYMASANSYSTGGLMAVRASDATQLWRYPILANWVAMRLNGRAIYVSASSGLIFAIDPDTGTEHWHYQTEVVPPSK